MTDADETRLVAWADEMVRAHGRLRQALGVVRESVAAGGPVPEPEQDLLLFCHGFCVALAGHHEGEDTALFPGLLEQRPDLAPVVDKLAQDHSMISHLLHGVRDGLDRRVSPGVLLTHLDGVGAIMESHFRYEERELLPVLADVSLDADPETAFGDL